MRALGLAWLIATTAAGAGREVAVTIDDLPVAQSGPEACEFGRLETLTKTLLAPLRERRVPVTAFVIGRTCPSLTRDQRARVLGLWREAGFELGNHSYSHPDLNRMPIEEYERDVLRGARELAAVPGMSPPRFFRWPMLHTGKEAAVRDRLRKFLAEHGWREAPVTFDNSDWMFAFVYGSALRTGNAALAERVRLAYVPYMESVVEFFEGRSVEVVGREFPQVLLLHANRLNAVMLPTLLDMLKRRGYSFVSLEQALEDPAYRMADGYAGTGGFSWIHRWSMTKGMPGRGEPDEPEWLRKEYERQAAR
jgi:peptidoglycan-N-acetylglucosamine deacetylase